MLTLSRWGGSVAPDQTGPVLGSVFRRRQVFLYGVGAVCLVAAAIISARYFVVGDTACTVRMLGDWPEVCAETMQQWSAVTIALTLLGLFFLYRGFRTLPR